MARWFLKLDTAVANWLAGLNDVQRVLILVGVATVAFWYVKCVIPKIFGPTKRH